MASTLIEMGALLRSVPGPDAPAAEVAAWYERKATLLEHVAMEAGPITEDGQRAAALARRARVRAAALTGVRPGVVWVARRGWWGGLRDGR